MKARTMHKKIYIMRHGRTVWNAEGRFQGQLDSTLLEDSKPLIENIAKYLCNKNIDIIYSSPLKRCIDTVNIISDIIDMPYQIDNELLECNHGQCDGLLFNEIIEKFPDEYALMQKNKWETKWPEGESYVDVFARAKQFLEKLQNNTSLIVAHATINKCLIGCLMNFNREQIFNINHDNAIVYLIENHTLFEMDFNNLTADEEPELVHVHQVDLHG
jgi:probable phosphoglycerate mutase